MLCTQLQALARHSVSVASISCSLQRQHDSEPEGQFRFLLFLSPWSSCDGFT